MTVPTYLTDLADVTTASSNSGWSELTNHTSGQAPATEQDYFIQGQACVSQAMGTKTGWAAGLEFDYGSSLTIAFEAGVTCAFFWQILLAGNAIDTFASGGMQVGIGSTAGNVNFWKSGGSDFGRNPYGGWQNIAVEPGFTADVAEGSPSTTFQIFTSNASLVAQVSKGNMHGVDAIRYGRGKLEVTNGEPATPCTFLGIAAANDEQNARWGLFQGIAGGYLWKGLMSIGAPATPCEVFDDSNRSITVDVTPRTYPAFNKIEFNSATSDVRWTNISVSALGATSLSPGRLESVTNASVRMDNCVFTDMQTFIFQPKSTLLTTTFRRCKEVTQNGAIMNGCNFEESIATKSALIVTDLDNIDNCDFTRDTTATSHAIELTASHAGGTYTLSGCTFTDYVGTIGLSLTGREAIYNNSGGLVTINVGVSQIPSHKNGAAASTLIQGSVDVDVKVKDTNGDNVATAQTAIYLTADRTEIINTDTDSNGEVSTSYSGTVPVGVEVRIRKASSGLTKYKNHSSLQTIEAVTGLSVTITMEVDPNNNAQS